MCRLLLFALLAFVEGEVFTPVGSYIAVRLNSEAVSIENHAVVAFIGGAVSTVKANDVIVINKATCQMVTVGPESLCVILESSVLGQITVSSFGANRAANFTDFLAAPPPPTQVPTLTPSPTGTPTMTLTSTPTSTGTTTRSATSTSTQTTSTTRTATRTPSLTNTVSYTATGSTTPTHSPSSTSTVSYTTTGSATPTLFVRVSGYVAADNSAAVTINGAVPAGWASSSSFSTPTQLPEVRVPFPSMIGITATNAGESANPAGVIAKFLINDSPLFTDATWSTGTTNPSGWDSPGTLPAGWVPAQLPPAGTWNGGVIDPNMAGSSWIWNSNSASVSPGTIYLRHSATASPPST